MKSQNNTYRYARRLAMSLASAAGALALVANAFAGDASPPLPSRAMLPTGTKPVVESWRAPQVQVNPEVPVSDTGEAFPMEAGKIVRVRDIPTAPAPEREMRRRFHIQGDDATDNANVHASYKTFKTEPASPASADPDTETARGTGDSVRSFTAIDSDDSFWIPPDHHLAVGPQYAVEVANSGFAIYTKLGGIGRSYRTFSNFLDDDLPSPWNGFMFDPRVVYAPGYEKYVMMILGKDEDNQKGYFWLAVSETSDPRDGWCIRRKNATDTGGSSTAWLDFAALGTDSFGVYVTGNYIYFSGGTRGAAIHSYPEELMTGCDSVTGWKFVNIQWPSGGDANSLQPAQAHTINSDGETFFVNTQPFSGDKVMLSRLSGDRGNAPVLTRAEIDIPAYNAIQNNVDQPGSGTDVDGGKSKAISAIYANHRVFFSLTTDVQNDGSASGWLTIKLDTDSNTRDWHHLLWSGEGRYLFYPALTLHGIGINNNIAVFGSWTDVETSDSPATYYPSGLFKLYENQPVDSTGRFTITTSGTDPYVVLDGNNRNRWGDYSGASYDWTCLHAWGVVQASTGATDWKTTIAAYEFDYDAPCPMMFVTSPILDEVWDSGTVRTVRWDSANLPAGDDVLVFALGTGTLTQIAGPLSPATTSIQWEVHEVPGEQNRIIVGSWHGSAYTALHFGDEFTIVDRGAPAPDPMTWQNPPQADSSNDISMRAIEATDVSAPVQYRFAATGSPTNGAGATDSVWTNTRDYTDASLEANHEYCYRARARDANFNNTGYTSTDCAYTLANEPAPAGFGEVTSLSVVVSWDAQGNSNFSEYQAQNVTEGTGSGWITGTSWLSDGLTGGMNYQFRVRARNGDDIVTPWVDLGVVATLATDPDGDGLPAGQDNCSLEYNPLQVDSDGDGIGNRCDTDLSQDCVTNTVDLGILKSRFFSNDPHADFNGDGVVNALDLAAMKNSFFTAPGPSGVTNICQ